MTTTMCHCGNPLHYSNPATQAAVEKLVRDLGEFQQVTIPGQGTWLVQRHYIALHGIKAAELADLGFQKVA